MVADLFDERNDAVKTMIAQLIQTARQFGVKVGICGQDPSDHSDFAEFLVEQGIDSISITPDLIKTIKAISAIKKMASSQDKILSK